MSNTKLTLLKASFDDGDESEGDDTLMDVTFIGEGTFDGKSCQPYLKSCTS